MFSMPTRCQSFAALMSVALAVCMAASAAAQAQPRQPASPAQSIQGGDLILAPVEGGAEYLVYSKHTGRWRRHALPPGVTAVPVIGASVAALMLEGKQISELVAVGRDGNWITCKLATPTDADCLPIVGGDVVAFHVGGRVYAFSGLTGTWDAIDASTTPSVSDDLVTVIENDRIAAFSAATGAWAETATTSQQQ